MSDDTLVAICDEQADRYISLYDFIGEVKRELAREERRLVHPVCYNINCIIWSLCELKDSIEDLRDIRVHDVSTLVDNSRAKIINLLNELYDNVKLSKLTAKHKILDYTVEFEKESIAAFKRHLDIDLKLLLSYGKDVDDVPLNKNTKNLISKSTYIPDNSRFFAAYMCYDLAKRLIAKGSMSEVLDLILNFLSLSISHRL